MRNCNWRTLVAIVPMLLASSLPAGLARAQTDQDEQAAVTVTGEVMRVDAKASTVTVVGANGEKKVFRVGTDTTIMSGSEEVGLAGLHRGEWVAIDADPHGAADAATYIEVVDDPNARKAKPEATAAGTTVIVGHNRLEPARVEIGAGETVTFRNVDKMPGGHTVVADDGSFSSPPLDKDQTWSHLFDVPGVYGVHIKEHPNTKASIVVQ